MSWSLIIGAFGLPALGVRGSALSTILAQGTTFVILLLFLKKRKDEYLQMNLLSPFRWEYAKRIVKVGGPPAEQRCPF